jgi:C4-dicarboxylate transporter DctM subunit
MSDTLIATIGIVALVLLFLSRMPVGFVMVLVGVVGFAVFSSVSPALAMSAQDFYAMFTSYSLSVAPMFILMGTLAFASGISSRLFEAANKWFGRLPGGLALATIAACAGFGAVCGSTTAACAAMGQVTLPEMKRYGYADRLRTGCVASAGSLAALIPPSTTLIIYGVLTENSIGKLFVAGIVPGLLLAVLYAATILLVVWRRPSLAPRGERVSWAQKWKGLKGTIDMLLLFALVMGGLFLGWFTPTEAGAVGAFGALVITSARRRTSLKALWKAAGETVRISAMVFTLLAGAIMFGHFMAITGAPAALAAWLGSLPLPPTVIMVFIVLIYVVGGCFMDGLALITLTIPILYPVVTSVGFNPIWFGVLVILCAEIGAITPPVGINVYVVKSVAPDVSLSAIFRGIFIFLVPEFVLAAMLLAVPGIATFLPDLVKY